MKKGLLFIFPFIILLSMVIPAGAAQISYTLSELGGGSWEYSYTITNNNINSGLYWFDIYFPELSGTESFNYSSITETANPDPTNWSALVFEPSALDLGGIYDVLALNTPLALNSSLGGFNVSFTYAGNAASGAQYFEIYDLDLNVLETGYTAAGASPVPEPGTMMLMGSGMLGLIGLRRKMRKG